MDSAELRIILGLALEIHLSEHVQGRLLTMLTQTGSALLLNRTSQLPATLAALETEGLAVITSSDNLILASPDKTLERKLLGRDGDNSTGRLVRAGGINDSNAAIMCRKCKTLSAWRERDRVHPTGRVVQVLSTDSVERKSLSPNARRGTLIHALDEGGEDSGMGIGRSSSEKDRVRVPGNAGDGAADRLLQVLGNPPVVLLLKVADGNNTVTRSNSELVLGRGPTNKGGGSADSEEDQSRLISSWGGLPDQSVTV